MKKICFIMTEAHQFNYLCRGQLEYFAMQPDVELTLVCGGQEQDLKKLESRNVGRVHFIGFVRRPSPFRDLLTLVQLFWFLIFNRFDVVVYSTPKALLLGSFASFFAFQKKRIALLRGRAYENYTGLKRSVFELIDKICLFISTKSVFIAESLRRQYVLENIASDKNSYVIRSGSSNGVDVKKFKVTPLQTDDSLFRVLVIGRVCIDKGIADLYEVVRNINSIGVEVLIVGNIDDNESKFHLDRILNDFEFVKYINYIDDPSIIFSHSDVHLFLSHRDGFGNVAIEAAACNVPTFCYDIIGLQDSVKQNVSGFRFPFGRTDLIALSINEAKLNQVEFKKKFSGSREWVLENFQSEDVWRGYINFYLSD